MTVNPGGPGLVLTADLRPGQVAFVDGDALRDAECGPVDAIMLEDNELAPQRAARAFAAAADRIIALLPGNPAGPVEVAGDGLLAHLIRAKLSTRAVRDPVSWPAAIVDTSGSPKRIADGLRRLDELGMLVLGGRVRGRDLTVNLYADLHRRSLTITGVPIVEDSGPPAPELGPTDGLVREQPQQIAVGAAVHPGACWYQLRPEPSSRS